MQPDTAQLKFSEAEDQILINRITSDFDAAITDHSARMKKFMRYYRMWRSRVAATGGTDGKSNYKVPLTKYQLLSKWAIEMDALFGDDAEVIADPTAPLDERNVVKIGRYMTWRVFKYMKSAIEFITFNFYKLLFGRSFAHVPYCVEKEDEEVTYDGPKFKTVWADNIVLPADCTDIQKCSFLIHRYKVSLQELLMGEQSGLYSGIKENFEKLYQASMNSEARDTRADNMTSQQDTYEGVERSNTQGDTTTLNVWAWYGNHRLLKGKDDAGMSDFKKRDIEETPVVIYYLPDVNLIVGRQNLKKVYPKMRGKRPFVTASLIKDGSFWSPGMAEVLEDQELELTVNHNLATDAGEKSGANMFGYKPASGMSPKRFKWEPNMFIPLDNPKDDLVPYKFQFNPQHFVLQDQKLRADAERLFGITDQNVGRANDRPNAPRTARGQLALIEQGSIRQSLDHMVLRLDFKEILFQIWQLDCCFAGEEVFFRVTEENGKGLIETENGFGKITPPERFGQMDLDIKFATSAHSKEQRKEREATVMQALFSLPIIAQNPAAQWQLADDFLKSYGKPGMGKYMPKPAELNMPVEPSEEWNLMLQGEDVHVHPMDDDNLHLEEHAAQIQKMLELAPEKRDNDALFKNMNHVQEHKEQQAMKLQQQAQMQAVQETLGGLVQGAQEQEGMQEGQAGGLMEGLQAGMMENQQTGEIPQ
jgi:hypothetical protein